MASIKDLFTREDCNKPERAKVGDEWIDYIGTDSDVFQKAKRQVQIDVISGKVKAEDVESILIASLIVGWSFEEECNTDNKIALTKNSPSIAEQIDRAASKRADVLGKLSKGSKPTQKKSST